MDEIENINAKSGNKLTSTTRDSVYTDLFFEDVKHPITYMCTFAKGKTCIAYTISTRNKATKDSLQKVIEGMSDERLAETAWIQKVDGKNYGWHLQNGKKFYSFSTTQIK